jgi:hypothetical protein
MNTTTTEAYFKTQADIPGSSTDNNYYVYYGHSSAFAPPARGANVYEFFDDFDNLYHWAFYGDPSVSNGEVELINNEVISRVACAPSVQNKVFEWRTRTNLSSGDEALWFGQQVDYDNPFVDGAICGYQCCDDVYVQRTLMFITSVINQASQTTFTAATHDASATDDTRSSAWDPGTGYNVYTMKWKANEVKYFHNQSAYATHAVDVYNAGYDLYMVAWDRNSSASSLYIDWALMRRYVDPEPSTSMASEEPSSQQTPVGSTVGGTTVRGGTMH